MDRPAVDGQRRLADGRRQRRVGMDADTHLPGGPLEQLRQHRLRDQVGDVVADHVSPDNLAGVGRRDDFYEALGVVIDHGAPQGRERELADLALHSRLGSLLLREPHTGDLGPRVGAAGHLVVVERLGLLARDHFDGVDALVRGDRAQLVAADNVADGENVGLAGAEIVVDLDEPRLNHNCRLVKPKTVDVGAAAHRQEQDLGAELLAAFDLHLHTVARGLDRFEVHLGPRHDGHTALLEGSLHRLRDLRVLERRDPGEGFDKGDSAAEVVPHRRKLDPDRPSADNDRRRGQRLQRESVVTVDDAFAVDLHARQALGVRAAGDDEVGGLDDARPSSTLNGHPLRRFEGPLALKDLDVVLLHQELESLVKLVDDLLLPLVGGRPIELQAADLDPGCGAVTSLLVDLGGVHQRLGGDAATVQAGATKTILLDQSHLESQLRCPDGGYVAAGACAKDDDVEPVSQLRAYP